MLVSYFIPLPSSLSASLNLKILTLFCELAQNDSSAGGNNEKKEDEEKAISGLLDGSGEYTLVYEDNEGDRMLVGDVPWQ